MVVRSGSKALLFSMIKTNILGEDNTKLAVVVRQSVNAALKVKLKSGQKESASSIC